MFQKSAIIEITNRCNLKCKMCVIWKEKPQKDMDTETFENILLILKKHKYKHIALTGGEPFLINIKKYYDIVRKIIPHSHVNISTNGTTSNILSTLSEIGQYNLGITISFDGMKGNKIIRGVDNLSPIKTAKLIQNKFKKINLAVKMTITKENFEEIYLTAKYFSNENIPLKFKIEENFLTHYNNDNKRHKYHTNENKIIVDQLKKVLKLKLKTNRRFIKKLITKNNKVICNWPYDKLYIDINENVFTCRNKKSLGSIKNTGINQIIRKSKNIMKNCTNTQCLCYSND